MAVTASRFQVLSLGSSMLGLSVGLASNDCARVGRNLNVAILVIPTLADDRPGLSRVRQDDTAGHALRCQPVPSGLPESAARYFGKNVWLAAESNRRP